MGSKYASIKYVIDIYIYMLYIKTGLATWLRNRSEALKLCKDYIYIILYIYIYLFIYLFIFIYIYIYIHMYCVYVMYYVCMIHRHMDEFETCAVLKLIQKSMILT